MGESREERSEIDAQRQELLLAWYSADGRDLPWRRTTDPYAVLVSEIMLQQTQVARVLPRFEAWLERWPTAEALASASTAEVLAAWSGLGYNSRALRLQQAAAAVATGGWPQDEAGLRELPGIGPYTAAAVAAFAFGQVAAAVDTNQERVINRWDGKHERTPAELRARALTLVPADAPAEWNHALMDLGATICTARRAACEACPMAATCGSAGIVDPDLERALRPGGATKAIPFEETARFVRGRIVATLAEHGPMREPDLVGALPAQLTEDRVRGALGTLQRDGLIERWPGGWQLPGAAGG